MLTGRGPAACPTSEDFEMQVANQDSAIRERAYAIWEEEGRPEGRAWDHWYRALEEFAGHVPTANGDSGAAPKAKPRKITKGRVRRVLKSALS
jgi:hypothetical protein